jgi:hypothetical protein
VLVPADRLFPRPAAEQSADDCFKGNAACAESGFEAGKLLFDRPNFRAIYRGRPKLPIDRLLGLSRSAAVDRYVPQFFRWLC